MEGSHVGTIVTLLAVAGGVAYVAVRTDLSSRETELKEVQVSLEIAKRGIAEKVTDLEASQKKLAALNEAVTKHESTKALVAGLQSEITALEGERESTRKQYVNTVENVRSRAVGAAYPEIQLINGKKLVSATLQKLTDSEFTIAHNDGVSKVPASDLPESLRRRFRIGMAPMLSGAAPQAASLPLAAPVSAAPPQPMPSQIAGSTANASKPVAGTASAAHLEIDIQNGELQMIQLTKTRDSWIKRAADLRFQATTAQLAGRPTYTLNAEAKKADQAAAAVDAQMTQLQGQLVILRKKLADATARPR